MQQPSATPCNLQAPLQGPSRRSSLPLPLPLSLQSLAWLHWQPAAMQLRMCVRVPLLMFIATQNSLLQYMERDKST